MASPTESSLNRKFCLCKCDYGGEFMVECDNNKLGACEYAWFHPACIGTTKQEIMKLVKGGPWFCPLCNLRMAKAEQAETGALRRSTRTCVRRKRRLQQAYGSPARKKRRVDKSESPKPKKKKAQTPLHRHNEAMNKKLRQLRKQRARWIKANYSAFEPYLTHSVKRRLGLSEETCAGVSAPAIEPLDEQPVLLNGGAGATLRDYQLTSLNFLRNLRHWGASAILADEMGLGKTIQTLAVLASLFEEENVRGPHLIICPLSVAEAWHDEARKWLPQLRTVLFHGPTAQRKAIMENKLVINQFDICICTYEISVSHRGFLSKFIWNYLVLDEAHRIKNEKTQWHNALKNIRALHSLMLTGTPIQNTMHELWALLHFCFPDLFAESEPFDDVFEHLSMEHDKELLGKVPKLLQPFYLRRLKSDVEFSLPPKEEIIVKLTMSKEQLKWYKMFLAHHANLIDKLSTDYNTNTANEWKKLRALFVQLRKIALHPYLLPNFHDRVVPSQKLVDASGKLQVMDALLTRLKQDGHRVLLFSCFTQVLDLMEVYLAYKRWKYLRLDGTTNRIKRKVDISRFNAPGSEYFVFLISNRAGGLGINLQSADTVIHFDTDWNPQADLQAQARAHRIGQKKMVKIYRLICQDTIEERILFRSQQKLYLDAIVNKGAKMLQDNVVEEFDMNNQDLLATISFGAQKLFTAEEDGNINGVDLDALLQRSHKISGENDETANESRSDLLKELETNNVRDFNFKLSLVSGNVFQGVEYKKAERITQIAELSARVRTKKTATIIVDGIKVDIDLRTRKNELATFYRYASDDIFDKANRSDMHHEDYCWGCDSPFSSRLDESRIIRCSHCPKSFHNSKKCWNGTLTRMGVYVCGQHECYECGAKTSQCGMLFRCVGCVRSFCPEEAPLAHWIRPEVGGMHYLDGCRVAEHFGYYIPTSTYMWICCSDECKSYYDTNYSQRSLPDLSKTFDDLPANFLRRLKSRRRKILRGEVTTLARNKPIGSFPVDPFVPKLSSGYRYEERIQDRLPFLDPFCDIIQEVYYLLGGKLPKNPNEVDIDDEEDSDDEIVVLDDKKEREEMCKDKVMSDVGSAVTPFVPQTIHEDVEMKTPMRSQPMVPTPIVIPRPEVIDLTSPVPRVTVHSGVTPMMGNLGVSLSRIDSDGDVEMKDGQKNASVSVVSNPSVPALRSPSTTVQSETTVPPRTEKKQKRPKSKPAEDKEIDYIGYILSWKGYQPKNPVDSDAFEDEIVEEFEKMYQSFSHWKSKSIKTLLDVLGCVVVTQVMSDGENKLTQVALSHPRQILAQNLAAFFILGDTSFLRLSSLELRR